MEISKCMGCMSEFRGYPCPSCGYTPGKQKGQEYALPPETILGGKYLVGRVLGQGGFGITYIGWDIALERKVAIKEYYPSGQVSRAPGTRTLTWYTSDSASKARQDGMQMFLKEARKMAKVDRIPNVVRILDLFQENETAYIVMDFVEGQTLKSILQKRGPMGWEQAQEIFLPAIRAMEKVHKAGLVHRDLSPDNLMLTPEGEVMILDLGAAKDLNINSGASSMQVAKGGFSPYEQYTQRGGSGPWTDVYAMAATIYYTLTGKVPPAAMDRMEEDTLRWDLPGLSALPAPTLAALKKAMAVQAQKRIQTMEELEKGLFAGAPARKKKSAKSKPEPKPQRGLPKWLLPTVAAVVVIAGGLGIWMKGSKPANEYRAAPETLAVQTVPAPESIPETTDQTTMLLEEAYQNAQTLMDSGKHLQAMRAFAELDYKDSAEKAQEAKEAYWVSQRASLSAGYRHTMGLRSDGSVVATKHTGDDDYGQCNVSGWTDIVAVAAGEYHTAGLRSDGTVVATGYNDDGRCNVRDWTDIVAVAAGYYHTVGLRSDGTAVATGHNGAGRCNVSGWTDIVAVAARGGHTMGLRSDGTVVATGSNDYGQCNVSGWTDIVAVAAGTWHTVGLRSDGTMVATGYNDYGQCNVSGWTDIVAVAAGGYHTVGLRSDGTLVVTGSNTAGQCNVSGWTDIVAVAAGQEHTVGLRSDGTVVATGWNLFGQCKVTGWKDIRIPN